MVPIVYSILKSAAFADVPVIVDQIDNLQLDDPVIDVIDIEEQDKNEKIQLKDNKEHKKTKKVKLDKAERKEKLEKKASEKKLKKEEWKRAHAEKMANVKSAINDKNLTSKEKVDKIVDELLLSKRLLLEQNVADIINESEQEEGTMEGQHFGLLWGNRSRGTWGDGGFLPRYDSYGTGRGYGMYNSYARHPSFGANEFGSSRSGHRLDEFRRGHHDRFSEFDNTYDSGHRHRSSDSWGSSDKDIMSWDRGHNRGSSRDRGSSSSGRRNDGFHNNNYGSNRWSI